MPHIGKKGLDVLRDRRLNKSTAFTKEEREALGLRGLLPYAVGSQQRQTNRVMANLRRKDSDIEKYIFLSALQDRNERLYYKVIMDNVEELLPIIYTPTVGEACKQFSHIYRLDKGFFITPDDRGQMANILKNWPEQEVKVIVVTDGSRILGLGDLGANGVGIPIGKLSLYSAMGGINPENCMPVMLDFGTNNADLLEDLLYLGYPSKRLEGDAYHSLIEEFIKAIQTVFPDALIQFEDFITPIAYQILKEYKDEVLCFNDDIQGTAAVALGGIYCSTRISGVSFKNSKILFCGAGSAATGIADLLIYAFMSEGLTKEEALSRLYFVDIHGLHTTNRTDLLPHNLPYAHDLPAMDFIEAIHNIKPNILIGASGASGVFTQEVIKSMAEINDRPVIFALSNPTTKAECTAEQAYSFSNGKAIFASGSPFAPITLNGKTFETGQANNVYIFPGIGLAATAIKAEKLPEEVFLTAARTLASLISEDELAEGRVYPRLTEMRKISLEIALSVSEKLFEMGLAGIDRPKYLREHIAATMYDPMY